MRKRIHVLAAAALAVGGIALAPHALAQQSQRDNQPGGQVGAGAGSGSTGSTPTGDRPGGVASQAGAGAQNARVSDVKFLITRVTDAALSEGGNAQLFAYLADQDRQRLSAGGQDQRQQQGNDHVRQNIQRLNQAWQQKYGKPFDIGTRPLAFNESNVRVVGADVRDAARTAGERIGGDRADAGAGGTGAASGSDATGTGSTGGTGTTGATAGGTADASGGTAGTGTGGGGPTGGTSGSGATGGTSGAGAGSTGAGVGASARGDLSGAPNDRASVIIPQVHNAPTVVLNLTRDNPSDTSWKLDLPDTVDAQKLQANLQRHIAIIADHPDQLPASEDEGYVLVAQHVLAAMTDASAADEPGGRDRADEGMNRGGQGRERPDQEPRAPRQPPQDQAPGRSGGNGSGSPQ